VAYWPFEEGTGATTQDKSGNGNDVTQATYASKPLLDIDGLNGERTIVYDGVDDFLSITDAAQTGLDVDASGSFTISTVAAIDDTGNWLVGKKSTQTGAGDAGYALYQANSTNVGFLVADSSIRAFVNASGLTNGQAYHIVGVLDRDTDTMSIYVDGVLIDDTESEGPVSSVGSLENAIDFTLGAAGGTTNDWDGRESSTLFYSKALTAQEITKLYNYEKGRFNL